MQAGKSRTQLILDQQQGGGEDGGDGGGRGIAGIVGNVLKPLQLFDVPRRIVLSALKEGADIAGGKPGADLFGNKTDEASWADFLSQVKDPTFGFGDIVGNATGNKWADRIIGFGGDVAFDPMSWVTLGANKIPGATGRLGLALAATEKNLGREVVEAAGRGGGQAVRALGDDAAVAALGDAIRPGLRFGTRNANVRIPGTVKLEEALSGAINRTRAPLVNTRAAQKVREWGVSRDPKTRALIEQIVTGQGDLAPREAAATLIGRRARTGAANTIEAMFGNTAEDVGRAFRDDPNITHMMETGVEDPRLEPWRSLEADILTAQRQRGASVGERPNRVSRVLTPEGRDIFELPTTNLGVAAAELQPGSQQFSRVIVPGVDEAGNPLKYRIVDEAGNGGDFIPVEGTIREANDWARANDLPKLYEDSPALLAARTVEDAAGAVGEASYINALRNVRVADPNDPTRTVPAALSSTQGIATVDQLNKAKSEAAGATRVEQLQPQLEAIQGKQARGQEFLEQTASDIVANVHRENETMLRIATDLDDEARVALTAANAAARKLGDPDKQVERVFKTATRLHNDATKKLAKAETDLAKIVERQTAFERTARTQRRTGYGKAHADMLAERQRLEKLVGDATEVVRQRDLMRKRLDRTVARDVAHTAATREARTALEAAEAIPPPATAAYVPVQGDIVRGDMYLPASAPKVTKQWNDKVAALNELVGRAQDMLTAGVDQTSREFADVTNRIKRATDGLGKLWAREAVPVPRNVPPGVATMPPEVAQRVQQVEARIAELQSSLGKANVNNAKVRAEIKRLQGVVDTARQRVAAAIPAPVDPLDALREQAEAAGKTMQATRALRSKQEAAKATLDERFRREPTAA